MTNIHICDTAVGGTPRKSLRDDRNREDYTVSGISECTELPLPVEIRLTIFLKRITLILTARKPQRLLLQHSTSRHYDTSGSLPYNHSPIL